MATPNAFASRRCDKYTSSQRKSRYLDPNFLPVKLIHSSCPSESLMHRKRLTIEAWDGFRTADFDGRIKSGSQGNRAANADLILPRVYLANRRTLSEIGRPITTLWTIKPRRRS